MKICNKNLANTGKRQCCPQAQFTDIAGEKLPVTSQAHRVEEEEEEGEGGAGRTELAECISVFIEHSVKCL